MKKNITPSKIIHNPHKPQPSELPHPKSPNHSGYQEKQPSDNPFPGKKTAK